MPVPELRVLQLVFTAWIAFPFVMLLALMVGMLTSRDMAYVTNYALSRTLAPYCLGAFAGCLTAAYWAASIAVNSNPCALCVPESTKLGLDFNVGHMSRGAAERCVQA